MGALRFILDRLAVAALALALLFALNVARAAADRPTNVAVVR